MYVSLKELKIKWVGYIIDNILRIEKILSDLDSRIISYDTWKLKVIIDLVPDIFNITRNIKHIFSSLVGFSVDKTLPQIMTLKLP